MKRIHPMSEKNIAEDSVEGEGNVTSEQRGYGKVGNGEEENTVL